MKKKNSILLLACTVILGAAILIACSGGDNVMSKKKGVYTVDTSTLGSNVKGYNGPTPLKIQIQKDKIVSVEALENSETPGFFQRVVKGGLLEKWNGMSVDEAMTAEVDVVSGATFSSRAVIENVRLGVKYYKEHK